MAADPANGLWLLPSRRRPGNLIRCMAALKACNTSTRGAILIDQDDRRELERDYAAVLEVLPAGWTIVTTTEESQGGKMREAEPLYRDADWIGWFGDDQEPATDSWDRKLIAAVRGWNIVSCNDDWTILGDATHPAGRFAGAWVFSGDLYRAVGYLMPPGMVHVFVDDAWEDIRSQVPMHSIVMDVLIRHYHFQNDKLLVPIDETYQRAYGHFGNADLQAWHQWRDDGGLASAVQKIRDLKARIGAP